MEVFFIPFTNTIWSLTFGNGVFCGVADKGQIAVSENYGISFGSLISNPFGAVNTIKSVAFIFNTFQACNSAGLTARSYDRGQTWTSEY